MCHHRALIVEGRRRDPTIDIVSKVSKSGLRHERVEIWDWRVLGRNVEGGKRCSEVGLPWFSGSIEHNASKKGIIEWLGDIATA